MPWRCARRAAAGVRGVHLGDLRRAAGRGRGAGDGLGGALGDPVLAVALGFAGGAVIASVADTLMPEAYADGGPLTAFATAAGFFLSFVLAA